MLKNPVRLARGLKFGLSFIYINTLCMQAAKKFVQTHPRLHCSPHAGLYIHRTCYQVIVRLVCSAVKTSWSIEIFNVAIYRGTYMSAHVLLILLNELGKFFATILIKFNNTGARMLDSIYHLTSRIP